MFRRKYILALVLFIVVGIAIAGYLFRWQLLAQVDEPLAAKLTCRMWTRQTLNNPASAQFDDLDSFKVIYRQKHYVITLGLRATNGFNALVYGRMSCEVYRIDGGFEPVEIRSIQP